MSTTTQPPADGQSFAEAALRLSGKSEEEARRTGAMDKADEQVEDLFAPQYQTVNSPVHKAVWDGKVPLDLFSPPPLPASAPCDFVMDASLDLVRRHREAHRRRHEERDRREATLPLSATSMGGKFQVVVKCSGGGFMGQAGAVKLAIARALLDYDPSVEPVLREQGMLTRDAREVERKKYGQAGARRRFQFSKR